MAGVALVRTAGPVGTLMFVRVRGLVASVLLTSNMRMTDPRLLAVPVGTTIGATTEGQGAGGAGGIAGSGGPGGQLTE